MARSNYFYGGNHDDCYSVHRVRIFNSIRLLLSAGLVSVAHGEWYGLFFVENVSQYDSRGLVFVFWLGCKLCALYPRGIDGSLDERISALGSNERINTFEAVFDIPGVGGLYLKSITVLDYDFFMLLSAFYTLVSLTAGIIIDVSYGLIDPRIRMGAK